MLVERDGRGEGSVIGGAGVGGGVCGGRGWGDGKGGEECEN